MRQPTGRVASSGLCGRLIAPGRCRRIEVVARRKRRKRCKPVGSGVTSRSISRGTSTVILATLLVCTLTGVAQGLRITSFRIPSYVPITLPGGAPVAASGAVGAPRHPLELSKPILFDCDYDYRPEEDTRLVVRWFKNKETEPFYQWLPERNTSTLADWMQPLVDQSFISDPIDSFKRYRSLLIRRLSMNLTGLYTCSVSSLAGQDSRVASLVIYQPAQTFTFKHRVFPSSSSSLLPAAAAPAQLAHTSTTRDALQPATMAPHLRPHIHPANNNNHNPSRTTSRPVFTHDGRPVRRNGRSIGAPPSDWQLRQRLAAGANREPQASSSTGNAAQPPSSIPSTSYQLQVHHFECQASQVTPRPLLLLTVKRGANSIAQYMHEVTRTSWHHYQVNQADYYGTDDPAGEPPLPVTLYDITASATVTLNVSLQHSGSASYGSSYDWAPTSGARYSAPASSADHRHLVPPGQPATVLQFRRGQRMSFECHLEVTGTEFGDKQRININEEEVYRLAELEEQKKLQNELQQASGRHMEAHANASSRAPAGPQPSAKLLSSYQLIATAWPALLYLARQLSGARGRILAAASKLADGLQ